MARPIVNKIIPFDANYAKELTYSWDGNQPYANRLVICDANTLDVVYDVKTEANTFANLHTIPAETLTNGRRWTAQFQVFDMDDIGSELSDKLLFHTYKTPLFYFYELEEGQTIRQASYDAQVYYYQENYEEPQSFKFYLYDGTKTLLLESDTMYDASKMRYTYKGLDNHTVYYLRCVGITANGMEIDTGYIQIYTDYEMPSTYGIIYAENDPLHGYIKYWTNIKVIQYNGNKIFNFIEGMIDLRKDSIYYDTGFVIENDFTLELRGMYLNQTATLLELRNTKYSLVLNSYLLDDGKTIFKISVPNGLGHYIRYSEPIAIESSDMVLVFIRRINDLYELLIITDPDFSMGNNYWYGQQMPFTPEEHDVWIDDENLFTYEVDKDDFTTHYCENESDIENLRVNDIWIGV